MANFVRVIILGPWRPSMKLRCWIRALTPRLNKRLSESLTRSDSLSWYRLSQISRVTRIVNGKAVASNAAHVDKAPAACDSERLAWDTARPSRPTPAPPVEGAQAAASTARPTHTHTNNHTRFLRGR